MALAAAPDVPGFHALSPLGYGPTSTIYSAQSTTLGRWVALTVYSANLPDERSQKKFRRAFDVARRLGIHPGAVTMLDCGLTAEKHAYVATEIYERGTLEGRSQGRPVPVDEVLHIGIVLAGALETAHRADVIHGGVHPGRVLLGSDGEPALADLGLVPIVERSGVAALVGPVSMCYHASPEVLEGEAVTPASDVFSLASSLYSALTGHPPYQRDIEDDTAASLLLRILQHDVLPVDRPDVPPSVEDALRRALSCSPRDRPGRALAFARSLQACQQELSRRVTEPVVMDVAASLGLAVAEDADEGHDAGFAARPAPPAPSYLPPPPPAPPLPAPSSSVFGASPSAASVFPDVPGVDPGRPRPPADFVLPADLGGPSSDPVPADPPPLPAALASQSAPAGAEPAPRPELAPAPSSNGASPVQRVFIPYPAPEPPDPLHRDEPDGPAAPSDLAGGSSSPVQGAVVPLFPADDRPAPPAPSAPQPPVRPEPPLGGLPPFQPDEPPGPPRLDVVPDPSPASSAFSAPAAPSAWPEHPGANDPSERRDDVGWLEIPIGEEDDPAVGAPPWPGGFGTAAVEPDGFVWPDDTRPPAAEAPAPEGLARPDGPRRNGNGLAAGIGVGWPDTPRRNGSTPTDTTAWPYVADRPSRNGDGPDHTDLAALPAAPASAPVDDDRGREHDRDRVRHDEHDGFADHEAPADRGPDSGGWAPSSAPADEASGDASPAVTDETTDPNMGVARALPVIAVGVIVAVLALGVAWVVMFGEDPGEQASQASTSAPPPEELQGDTAVDDSVMAVENPTGVQLDWGATTGAQVVVILSDTQPPRTLPAKTGSALLVPASSLDPDGGYCFAVVPSTDPLPTPADLAADLPDDALRPGACIRGATADSVRP
jgi:serine/threonine protein kinase